jgi:hypothetical protein
MQQAEYRLGGKIISLKKKIGRFFFDQIFISILSLDVNQIKLFWRK